MLTGILIAMFVLSGADEEKCSLRFMKLKCEKNFTIENCSNYKNSFVCKKEFTISLVSYAPHDFGINYLFMKHVLLPCCNDCIRNKTHSIPTLADFLRSTNDTNATKADFVLPILAPKLTSKIYGYNYYPIVKAPPGVYVTMRPTEAKIYTLLKTCFEMWPLLVVCLAMAIIAGFITWLLDTWPNSEQFPRPFISGVLEGFWWSFVSMTTIGYGDKSPLGWPARLFAVIWIFVGITICSLLTASITSTLTTPVPAPVMSGKKVGILENRVYDQLFVLKKKGKPIEFKDITELMKQLDVGNINGAFFDRMAWTVFLNNSINDYDATFFSYDGDGLTFGLLISDSSVSTFIGDYIKDHNMAFDLCTEEIFQSLAENFVTSSSLFDPKNQLFKHTLYACGILFVIIGVFGFFYERKRRKKFTSQPNEKPTRNDDQQNEKKLQLSENISRNIFVQRF